MEQPKSPKLTLCSILSIVVQKEIFDKIPTLCALNGVMISEKSLGPDFLNEKISVN